MSEPQDGENGNILASGWRTNGVRSRDVQTVRKGGREYLQFPLVPLTEMVLDYPENDTREYLPKEHIRETAGLWDGTLLTHVHPENRNRTVRDADAFMGQVIGAFYDPQALDGGETLTGNGLIDVAKANAIGGSAAELVDLLQRGEEVSVSAGYRTGDDEHQSGRFDGDQYDLVQGPPLPDHIAVFPSSSQPQARCSPEDGCAAPRANVAQSGQGGNQRATNDGVSANMSESDVDATEEQRQLTSELRALFEAVESMGVASDRQVGELRRLRNVTNGLGDVLENDSVDVSPALGAVVRESKALIADILNEGTESSDERANADACDCRGVCRCDPFTSTKSTSGTPNMAAVPGGVNRNYGRREQQGEDADEYPAGGRSNWEKRQVGLAGASDGDDDLPPAGGRSAWEARNREARTNTMESAAETSLSAGARRSLSSASNTVEVSEVAGAKYPLTALRAEEAKRAKEDRWNRLREMARRSPLSR